MTDIKRRGDLPCTSVLFLLRSCEAILLATPRQPCTAEPSEDHISSTLSSQFSTRRRVLASRTRKRARGSKAWVTQEAKASSSSPCQSPEPSRMAASLISPGMISIEYSLTSRFPGDPKPLPWSSQANIPDDLASAPTRGHRGRADCRTGQTPDCPQASGSISKSWTSTSKGHAHEPTLTSTPCARSSLRSAVPMKPHTSLLAPLSSTKSHVARLVRPLFGRNWRSSTTPSTSRMPSQCAKKGLSIVFL